MSAPPTDLTLSVSPSTRGVNAVFGDLLVKRVPRSVLRGLSEIAAQHDMSRSAFIRSLLSSVAAEDALRRSYADLVIESEEQPLSV